MIASDLNRELAVWRPVKTADGSGGQTVTPTQVGTVRARVSQPSAVERVAAMQAGAAQTMPIYLMPDADVHRGDELRATGEVFRVKATIVPSEPAYLRADCERIESEPASA